jgi:hypothetical protein
VCSVTGLSEDEAEKLLSKHGYDSSHCIHVFFDEMFGDESAHPTSPSPSSSSSSVTSSISASSNSSSASNMSAADQARERANEERIRRYVEGTQLILFVFFLRWLCVVFCFDLQSMISIIYVQYLHASFSLFLSPPKNS